MVLDPLLTDAKLIHQTANPHARLLNFLNPLVFYLTPILHNPIQKNPQVVHYSTLIPQKISSNENENLFHRAKICH